MRSEEIAYTIPFPSVMRAAALPQRSASDLFKASAILASLRARGFQGLSRISPTDLISFAREMAAVGYVRVPPESAEAVSMAIDNLAAPGAMGSSVSWAPAAARPFPGDKTIWRDDAWVAMRRRARSAVRRAILARASGGWGSVRVTMGSAFAPFARLVLAQEAPGAVLARVGRRDYSIRFGEGPQLSRPVPVSCRRLFDPASVSDKSASVCSGEFYRDGDRPEDEHFIEIAGAL
jgi:hypothetical protein